ncbi:MAG: helix-turn-helix domain-containing protein [Candidatus Lokiarchaeota archaeon]|nr:helix-turn-helix domain-containing protein [Candidatus Lokiarchaeota archaeon]
MALKEEKQRISLDNLLEIIGNPTRRVILSKLSKIPHSTSELSNTLEISRQAVHSQLEILKNHDIIERMNPEERGSKYKIKSNLSLRIDITPDYYHIKYEMTSIDPSLEAIFPKNSDIYDKIKTPNQKMKYLGDNIKEIEQNLYKLELNRRKFLQKKESFIIELKHLMEQQYRDKLRKKKSTLDNLEMEIFYTLFFNPVKFHSKINIDSLLDELFFSDIDRISRASHRTSIEHLLRDLAKSMDILREVDNNWFFDI